MTDSSGGSDEQRGRGGGLARARTGARAVTVLALALGTGGCSGDDGAAASETAPTAAATVASQTGTTATSSPTATGPTSSAGTSTSTASSSTAGPTTTSTTTSTTTATTTSTSSTTDATSSSSTGAPDTQTESGSGGVCVDDQGSCAMGETCCEGLKCCGGEVPPGQEFCAVMCPISDREQKRGFRPVDPASVLAKVVTELPISTWSYRADATGTRHLGPMAQDFKAAFAVGSTDRAIFTVDADGVALAAIQGLHAQLEAARAENRRLGGRLAALEERLAALENR